MDAIFPLYAAGAGALAISLPKLASRLRLSKAKHPSLRGHARVSRWVASKVPFYDYDDADIFRSDDAPDDIADRRRAGFMRLCSLYGERFPKTTQRTREVMAAVSDVQFTDAYRVPFQ